MLLLAALLAVQLRQRERIAGMLREREARYRLIETNIADIVILADRDGTLTFVSMSVRSVLGITPDEMLGRNCLEIVHPDDIEAVRHYGTRLGQNGAGRRVEFRTTHADGTLIWLEAHFRIVADAQGSGRHMVGTLRDITRRKQVEDEVEALNFRLAQMATTDALTGLPNRRALDDHLGRSFDEHLRVAVLMIDVDEFKSFNDNLGHQAGDLGLQRIAELLAHAVAGTKGIAARYGGEEFAIILPGADVAAALTFAEKLRMGVRDLKIANPAARRGIVTISIGIADKTGSAPNAATLLRDADMALYEAKRRGRDCCVTAALLITDDAPLAPDGDQAGFGAVA
ncbi:GGDEF domain-containing protein [Rhodopseudomonas sp. B29]|uniref:GGDEF domain-containing protein n=1 Tax=Rhodopseudomonas sp. B29 TaxID=95607 RepID=UPI00034DDA29|nr:diguanylate cyclase [Rhodopseudomonas sp. B29]